ncbi:Uncharacterised protein [Mycobacteroides abscessus]|uniref:hypothetical protein n=1 Tax=Mycobacteroides abscessus TaxID=36809 RepID=UPI0005E7D69B|nr:hypothetical protein [Mycobacteroides abscessus]CPU58069.1 Uncharacterised protein [Mycobacteroides abscessus]CPU61300.1 Uncharacterised protein [Mycobacteroides abscessus]CPU61531.1 Uncharacterised protein [Mycobacteroides abscessus]CPV40243.1 Uncharacterised protein [Mycobacteroides abscessus]
MTGGVSAAEAKRRADLLYALYAALTTGGPGLDYRLHMDPTDPVAVALTDGREKVYDLALMASNDNVFDVWRLRLGHPQWWRGGRVRRTTPLLARLISELTGRHDDGPHLGSSGYVGAHWFNQSLRAIAPLSSPARDQLAVALRRELIGRNMCLHGIVFMSFVSDRTFNPAEMFPEAEHVEPVDLDRLTDAAYELHKIHGAGWVEAFSELVSGLDPVTWAGVTAALKVELPERRTERE